MLAGLDKQTEERVTTNPVGLDKQTEERVTTNLYGQYLTSDWRALAFFLERNGGGVARVATRRGASRRAAVPSLQKTQPISNES